MPITRLSTDVERSSTRKIPQEPSKVAGIQNKPRVETGGGGGGGPGANVAGKRATKAPSGGSPPNGACQSYYDFARSVSFFLAVD